MISNVEDERPRHKFWGLPVPEGNKHGPNTSAKQKYGCACKLCLPSGRRIRPPGQGKSRLERDRELRKRKLGQPVPPGTKHGKYAHHVYGCRCDVCVAGARTSSRPTTARTRGVWTDDGETVTLCWPPRGAGPDWTCPHPSHLEEP